MYVQFSLLTQSQDLENDEDESNANSDEELEDLATNSHAKHDVEIKNASESGDSVPEIGDLDDGINGFRTTAAASAAVATTTSPTDDESSKTAALSKMLSPQKLVANAFACNSTGTSAMQHITSMLTNQTTIASTLPNILQGEEPIADERADDMMKSSPGKLSLMNNHHNNIQNGYLTDPSN